MKKDNSVEDGGSRSIDSSMRGLFASQHTGWSFKMFPGSAFGEYFGGGFIGTVLRSGNGVCHISDKGLNGDWHFAGVSRKHVRSAALRTGI